MTKRFLALACITVFLSACSQSSFISGLPAEEVLQKVARASQTLESANYNGTAVFSTEFNGVLLASADLNISGSFDSNAKQLHFTVEGDGNMSDGEGNSTLKGLIEAIIVNQDEVYMKVDKLAIEPENNLVRTEMITRIVDTWWRLPVNDQTGNVESPVSTDPRLLRAQSEVVSVVKDYGVEKLEGNDVYHYDVKVDPNKLLAYLRQSAVEEQGEVIDEKRILDILSRTDIDGTFWIDATTFYPRKIEWKVAKKENQPGAMYTLDFAMLFSAFNAADPIAPPSESQLFSPFAIVNDPATQLFPYDKIEDEPFPIPEGGELTPEQQDEIIRQLLDGQSYSPPTE